MYDLQVQEAWFYQVPIIANSDRCQSPRDDANDYGSRSSAFCYISDLITTINSFVSITYFIT